MGEIRRFVLEEFDEVLDIINAAAVSYRGVIPAEHWHDPYMSAVQLRHEIEERVEFWVETAGDSIAGVMGIQRVVDVDLVRHAYVGPQFQGGGVGSRLLTHLRQLSTLPVLIGTWAAATNAIQFYQSRGFVLLDRKPAQQLLQRYWDVSEEQMVHSVVLAEPRAMLQTESNKEGET